MEILADFISKNLLLTIVGTVTLIQIVPIKINPWSFIGQSVKSFFVGDLEKELRALKHDIMADKVETKRWNILDFSNSCRQGIHHTKEEWEHCISELSWYEDYCDRNNIPNGVIKECTTYLRTAFQKRLEKNDFLQ